MLRNISSLATKEGKFDETEELLAISVLLKIAHQLVLSINELFQIRRAYAASALLRQLVEVEYLIYAFDTGSRAGKDWLNSTKEERFELFTPAKLRKAAQGNFRSKDYGYHCELGGHPTPTATILLLDDGKMSQLLLSDMLGHTGRIWDHLTSWAEKRKSANSILQYRPTMVKKYVEWKSEDPLTTLPPPP